MYICIMHTYIYMDIHTYIKPVFRTCSYTTHVGTRACACPHVCADTRENASVVPPRTTARAASTTRRARPPAVVRRRAEKAAHTWSMFDTEAVFHAPMFALNADAALNACEPRPPAVDAADGRRSHVSARMRARPIAHAHTRAPNRTRTHARAHGRSTCARVCGGPASAIRSSG